MGTYRKRPIEIEAIRWVGYNWDDLIEFLGLPDAPARNLDNDKFVIDTLEGAMTADVGDWVIRGVAGELYPCKDEIFRVTYEHVEDAGELVEAQLPLAIDESFTRVSRVLYEDREFLTVEVAKADDLAFTVNHGDRFLCLVFVDGDQAWLPWEEE